MFKTQVPNGLYNQFAAVFAEARFTRLLEECWEVQPRYLKDFFPGSLFREFSISSIDEAIATIDPRLPRAEVLDNGKKVDWSCLSSGCATPVAIHVALEAGLTLLAQRFELYHKATEALARALTDRIEREVFASLYLTRKDGAAAFPAHYDAANVFALQLFGVKRWELYYRVSPPPEVDSDVRDVTVGPEEITQCEHLAPGDLLYNPRGNIHSVSASCAPCLHIAFGIWNLKSDLAEPAGPYSQIIES
jgi:ribosomal protein L16 Arg81 hydroxylase